MQALKYDSDKLDYLIIPQAAHQEIIRCFEYGAQKYARGNFLQGMEYSRILNSLLRHTHQFAAGQDLDPESNLPHLAHMGCNVYMLLTYQLHNLGTDNRLEWTIP